MLNLNDLKDIASQVANYNDLTSLIKSDADLHTAIVKLSSKYLNRRPSGCVNCMADAFTELVTLKHTYIMEKEKLVFGIKSGAMLFDPDTRSLDKNTLTAATITNDLAIFHILKRGKAVLKFFTRVPENLDEMIAEYEERNKPIEPLENPDDNGDTLTDGQKAAIEAENVAAELAAKKAKKASDDLAKAALSTEKLAAKAAAKTESMSAAATPVADAVPAELSDDDKENLELIKAMLLEGLDEKTILELFDVDVAKLIAVAKF